MRKSTPGEKMVTQAENLGIKLSAPAAVTAFARGDLENARIAGTPGGIEAQEAAGQAQMVQSQQLPKEKLLKYQEQLEAMGFKFGKNIDDVFIEVTLPAGWCKKGTDYNMWSDLLDDKGRRRAGIFYKAAFYDRNGCMHWSCRFSTGMRLEDGRNLYKMGDDEQLRCYAVVLDAGTEVYRTELSSGALSGNVHNNANQQLQEPLAEEAAKWLSEKYPNWRDEFAYWDD